MNKQVISLPHEWRPRVYQESAWRAFEGGVNRFALVWPRRSGKDDFALRATSVAVHRRVASYWHMLPEAAQARKAIWDAVNPHSEKRRIDEAFPDSICKKRDNDMSIKFNNGSMWHVVGSDNYNSLVGSPPAGVVFSEWPLANPEAWGYLRPILAENGGWAMFLYTPRGPNHGLRTFQLAESSPDWFGQRLTADDLVKSYNLETGEPEMVYTQAQLDGELKELINDYGPDMGKSLFEQEYYCSFEAAVVGSIYGPQMGAARDSGRITNVMHDPMYPVGTMWDLGYTDSTAIWFFQLVGQQVRFIDFYEASNVSLTHYAEVLREKKEQRGFKYSSNHMYFPHDVAQVQLVAGKNPRQALYEMGIPVVTVPKTPIWDGIDVVRRAFHRFMFDVKHCEKGIEHLTMYARKWDSKLRVFNNKPEHSEHSHAADALRVGAQMLPETATDDIIGNTPRDYRRKKKVISAPSPWSM